MGKYYEEETPVTFIDRYGCEVSFYRKAGVLALSRPQWTTPEGEVRHGKTVSFSFKRNRGQEELIQIMTEVLECLKS